MESQKDTQTHKGHVSAQGESPKDDKQPQAHSGEGPQVQRESPGQSERVSVGIELLDKLIEEATLESKVMAYVCLNMNRADPALAEKTQAMLEQDLESFRKGNVPGGLDLEAEVLPAYQWDSFLAGFQAAGERHQREEQQAPARIDETSQEEPKPLAFVRDTKAVDTREAEQEVEAKQPEDRESEGESYGFNPKEQVRAYQVFEQWLKNRTLEEKQAALALSMLLGKQQYLPDEHLGDKLYKKWRADVLSVRGLEESWLKDLPGNEAFNKGFLTAMIVMDA